MGYERIVQPQLDKYNENDGKMQELLDRMSDREIALITISQFARDAGVSRSTVHRHQNIYVQLIKGKK